MWGKDGFYLAALGKDLLFQCGPGARNHDTSKIFIINGADTPYRMGQKDHSAVESFVRSKLGIGLPPVMKNDNSFVLRSDQGLDLEKDSILNRSEGEDDPEARRELNSLLEEIGRDLDEMASAVMRFRTIRERLR